MAMRRPGMPQGGMLLSGTWEFRLDPDSVGESQRWFDSRTPFSETIRVPGCWDAQGKGIPGRITTLPAADDTAPFVRTVTAYEGIAWYRRIVHLPESLRGKTLWLNVGAVNARAKVWLNGRPVGSHDGYCTSFKLDVTNQARLGQDNLLAIQVSNARLPEGNLEGCLDFYTHWGGIYRDVWLEATGPSWIDDLRALPDLTNSTARVRLRIGSKADGNAKLALRLYAPDGKKAILLREVPVGLQDGVEPIEIELPVRNPKLWSPDSPALYRITAELTDGRGLCDAVEQRFGMREIRVEGKRILLNGKPIFLRGYGDDCIYPLTVAPPASKEHYLKELRTARSYGFNYARHHTWVPTPEHLEAADEVGMLMQLELPTGLHPISDPSPYLQKLWKDELLRIIGANANHPSVAIYCLANELGDSLKDPKIAGIFYGMTALARKADPTRLVAVTSGSTTPLPPEETHYDRGVYGIRPFRARWEDVAGWIAGHDRPYLWHEMGYYASYPDPSLRGRYPKGTIPFWINEAQRIAEEKGLASLLPAFVRNSQRLQLICDKWSFELARKCAALPGYQWWTFKDNSWPTEGIVDDFGEPKPGIDRETIRRVNSESVLLLEQEPRTHRAGDQLALKVLLSHFGDKPIDGRLAWELRSGSTIAAKGTLKAAHAPCGALSTLGIVNLTLPTCEKPGRYELAVSLSDGSRRIENAWPLWVFPKASPLPAGVSVCDPNGHLQGLAGDLPRLTGHSERSEESQAKTGTTPKAILRSAQDDSTAGAIPRFARNNTVVLSTALTPESLDWLEKGGRMLLISRLADTGLPERISEAQSDDIPYPLYFAPTYWGAAFAPGGGNLGTVIADHPALGSFPHEGFCDLQFIELLYDIHRTDLDLLPVKINPIIRSITDWRVGGNAGFLWEARVGRGRLLVTTLNLEATLRANRPEAGWLLGELLRYVASPAFEPEAALPPSYLRSVLPHQVDQPGARVLGTGD